MSEYVCDCVEYNGWWYDCNSRWGEVGREGEVDMMGRKHVFMWHQYGGGDGGRGGGGGVLYVFHGQKGYH